MNLGAWVSWTIVVVSSTLLALTLLAVFLIKKHVHLFDATFFAPWTGHSSPRVFDIVLLFENVRINEEFEDMIWGMGSMDRLVASGVVAALVGYMSVSAFVLLHRYTAIVFACVTAVFLYANRSFQLDLSSEEGRVKAEVLGWKVDEVALEVGLVVPMVFGCWGLSVNDFPLSEYHEALFVLVLACLHWHSKLTPRWWMSLCYCLLAILVNELPHVLLDEARLREYCFLPLVCFVFLTFLLYSRFRELVTMYVSLLSKKVGSDELLKSWHEAALVVSADEVVVAVNDAAVALLGAPDASPIVGQFLSNILQVDEGVSEKAPLRHSRLQPARLIKFTEEEVWCNAIRLALTHTKASTPTWAVLILPGTFALENELKWTYKKLFDTQEALRLSRMSTDSKPIMDLARGVRTSLTAIYNVTDLLREFRHRRLDEAATDLTRSCREILTQVELLMAPPGMEDDFSSLSLDARRLTAVSSGPSRTMSTSMSSTSSSTSASVSTNASTITINTGTSSGAPSSLSGPSFHSTPTVMKSSRSRSHRESRSAEGRTHERPGEVVVAQGVRSSHRSSRHHKERENSEARGGQRDGGSGSGGGGRQGGGSGGGGEGRRERRPSRSGPGGERNLESDRVRREEMDDKGRGVEWDGDKEREKEGESGSPKGRGDQGGDQGGGGGGGGGGGVGGGSGGGGGGSNSSSICLDSGIERGSGDLLWGSGSTSRARVTLPSQQGGYGDYEQHVNADERRLLEEDGRDLTVSRHSPDPVQGQHGHDRRSDGGAAQGHMQEWRLAPREEASALGAELGRASHGDSEVWSSSKARGRVSSRLRRRDSPQQGSESLAQSSPSRSSSHSSHSRSHSRSQSQSQSHSGTPSSSYSSSTSLLSGVDREMLDS